MLFAQITFPDESYFVTKMSLNKIELEFASVNEPNEIVGEEKFPHTKTLPEVSVVTLFPAFILEPPYPLAQITFPAGSYLTRKIFSIPELVSVKVPKVIVGEKK